MAYKVFQNGYPLSASELNNYLMNQTVMAFASAAERDSVLTAPTDGMVVYLQDTNILKSFNGSSWVDINDNTDAIQKSLLTTAGDTIYATGASTPARLALGSTGSIIKSTGSAPTWLAPGTSGQVLSSTGSDLAWTTVSSGGGKTLLSTTTLSGSTTSITGISQSYKDLIIRVQGATFSTVTKINVSAYSGATNIGNPDLTGVVYNGSTSSATTDGFGLPSSGSFKATGGQNVATLIIDNYTDTSNMYKTCAKYGGAELSTSVGSRFSLAGRYWTVTSGAINRLDFFTDAGAFTGGSVLIYGVN